MNYIKVKKNSLYVDSVPAIRLAKRFDTPFYCYSLSQLKYNYNILNHAFKNVRPIMCFSVKSNSNINLLKELKKSLLLNGNPKGHLNKFSRGTQ